MKKNIFILFICLFAGFQGVKAQFDTQLSNYWATTNYFNPGSVGQSGNLELTGLYRLQWLGIENAPKSGIVLAEMPFNFAGRNHGVGASMYNDQLGLFKSTVISGQYAYMTKLWGGNLGIGIQAGYIQESFDGTGIDIPIDDEYHDPNDEAIPTTKVSGSSIDASFGIYYKGKNWYAGLSATHLLAPKLELDDNYILEIPRSYYFTAGYNIQLNNPLLELRSSVLLRTTELSSWTVEGDSLISVTESNTLKGMLKQSQIDVSLRMIYNKTFWGGISWRKGDALMILLGGKFKMLEVGYAYDFPISDIIKESSGSHELFVKYVLDMNLKKGTKSKHKSVRIL